MMHDECLGRALHQIALSRMCGNNVADLIGDAAFECQRHARKRMPQGLAALTLPALPVGTDFVLEQFADVSQNCARDHRVHVDGQCASHKVPHGFGTLPRNMYHAALVLHKGDGTIRHQQRERNFAQIVEAQGAPLKSPDPGLGNLLAQLRSLNPLELRPQREDRLADALGLGRQTSQLKWRRRPESVGELTRACDVCTFGADRIRELRWPPMKFKQLQLIVIIVLVCLSTLSFGQSAAGQRSTPATNVYPMQEGFVDAHGVMIYYKTLGRGNPLMIVHGGPGASHDYFLPYLLPLARQNKLVFIDERGSGRSQKLDDASGYTIENMVEDVDAVRVALGLGKVTLLGHSYGGALAEAYALRYEKNLTHLILGSTWCSTNALNEVFVRMKQNMTPELRNRIDQLEANGLFGHGKDYEKNRYTNAYMIAAWGEGYFPYVYHNHPDANYDPIDNGKMSWDLYREMWGEHGEFVIDGNLKSVEYTDRLSTIKVPTLILVGDHDESDPSMSKVMQQKIAGSKLVIFPNSGHMTFVDQPKMFIDSVDEFLHGSK